MFVYAAGAGMDVWYRSVTRFCDHFFFRVYIYDGLGRAEEEGFQARLFDCNGGGRVFSRANGDLSAYGLYWRFYKEKKNARERERERDREREREQ